MQAQTAYVLALAQDLLPDALRQKAADKLAGMIRDNQHHMTTGFLGTSALLLVLSANGHHDLAVRLFQSREFPGWGYEVENGATTIWLGALEQLHEGGRLLRARHELLQPLFVRRGWRMDVPLAGRDRFRRRRLSEDRHQAGTAPNADRTPAPVKWVNAFYDSIHGKIVSKWKHEDGRFQLEVTIPPNTTALVMIPAASASKVTESGRAIGPTGDVKFLRQEGDRAVFETQSGTYRFLAGR